MEALINTIFYILVPNIVVDYSVCNMPLDHLTIEEKLEISIGCSYVNGNRVYSDTKLRGIYYDEQI